MLCCKENYKIMLSNMVGMLTVLTILIYSGTAKRFLDTHVPTVQTDPLVDTDCGQVRGSVSPNGGAFSFRGIPNASPPVRELRWRPPVPMSKLNHNCWTGTLQADRYGNQCVQRNKINKSHVIGHEDCLFLNVFTPTLNSSSKLPVMFWIHGGSLTKGNGGDDIYGPSEEHAKKLNVVFVGINYRLQAFGFMALKLLKDVSPTNTSGNYGLMDMIEALRWVQRNVKHFGGDPGKVTVFGQSSGGTAIFALLASPLCQKLFHKAWLMSASPILNKTADDAFVDNEVFLNKTGCDDVMCLYNLTAEEVTRSVPWDEYPFWAMSDLLEIPEKGRFDGALAIVDGYVLQETPFDTWVHGNGVDVPVLIGTTAQEVSYFMKPSEATSWTWNDRNYSDYVTTSLRQYGDVVALTALKLYPQDVETPFYQLTSMVSDMRATCGNDYLATIMSSAYQSSVYRYVATYISKGKNAPFSPKDGLYAFHGIDLLAFFGTISKVYADVSEGFKTWEDLVQNEVMSFVTDGRPITRDWMAYPGSVAELGNITTVEKGYHIAQCEFWLANNFFSYSWIN